MKILYYNLRNLLNENFGTDCMMEYYQTYITIDDLKVYIDESNGLYNLYINRYLELKEVSRREIKSKIRELIK